MRSLAIDTARLEVVLGLVVDVGVVQHGLGGNASDVQAGTAESAALLNTGSLVSMDSFLFVSLICFRLEQYKKKRWCVP